MIAKQPNGLYCRFSSIVECPTDWNMTEEDYIEMRAEQAREEARNILARYVKPFSQVVKNTHPINMTIKELIKAFSEMGYTPTQKDIIAWERWGKD